MNTIEKRARFTDRIHPESHDRTARYTLVKGAAFLEGVDLEVHGAQRRIREEGVVLAEHGQRVLRRAVCEVLERNRARLRVQPVWHGTGRWVAGGLVVGWG